MPYLLLSKLVHQDLDDSVLVLNNGLKKLIEIVLARECYVVTIWVLVLKGYLEAVVLSKPLLEGPKAWGGGGVRATSMEGGRGGGARRRKPTLSPLILK